MGKQTATWITPFKRQCFVTLGVSLNLSSYGLVLGFSAILLPQLREPGSIIQIDDSSGSWIASIVGFALIVGNLIVPSLMARYGRCSANQISAILILFGWFWVLSATNITSLLCARFIQGIAIGMASTLGPLLIGEYTSPENRGAFLMTVSLAIALAVLAVHTMGFYLSWQTTALICAFITFVDLIIVMLSPESPCWLAEHGLYEESKSTFRWLRGDGEEIELQNMIDASIAIKQSKAEMNKKLPFVKKIRSDFAYFSVTVKKREFFIPILIMIHIYTLSQWAGANILTSYTQDIYHHVIGHDVDVSFMIITMDIQRIISNACAVYVIKKVKRRTMVFATVCINLIALLSIAAYTYCKSLHILPFDHPLIGAVLMHIHMFSLATGTVPLPFTIAGEIFPLEYRSLAGGISVLFLSVNLFLSVKTLPPLFNSLGFHGAYCLYAAIVAYCLMVTWKFLPETKGKTLQEIEDGFRGRPLSPEELKSVESLTSWKFKNNIDRRCSTPFIS